MNLDNTVQAMQKLGGKVVEDGRKILKRKKKTTKKNTLYRDFDYLVQRSQTGVELIFEFGRAEDYWDFVDEGVRGSGGFKGSGKMRGHGSPFKFRGKNIKKGVVREWIKNKPIRLRGADGRFMEKSETNIKSAAFLIGRAIAQRGLTRTQFFSKPLTQQLKKQSDAIVEAFGNDLEKQLELVIGK
jgi:hypothetical protein|tara:strand:+ start:867 stop:1421 length:555 start_codon:yes stop_codon:yes gene_type:complete